MSTEENKAIVHRIFEDIMNNRDMDLIDDLFSTNYVFHGSGGHELRGPNGFKKIISQPHTAYPDFHITAEEMVAEGDKVACRFTCQGTHKGMLKDIAPTNKQMKTTGIVIYRIVDGKVVEHWENMDMLGMMQQLVPPSPRK